MNLEYRKTNDTTSGWTSTRKNAKGGANFSGGPTFRGGQLFGGGQLYGEYSSP